MARTLRTTMRVWPAILVCLALLAGCGGEEAATSSGGGGDGEKLAGPITFRLTGGDAFREDRMTVQPDGSAQVTTREGEKPAQLTEKEVSTLAAELADANFAKIPENSTTEPPIPDALSYSFSYQDREVVTDSGSLPEQLKPLIATFTKLVERHGP